MRLEEFSLKEPFWVVVGALLVLVLGTVSFFKLPKDILPIFKTAAVQVLTFYPGMPAEVVEKDMTTRLERWTGQSNGIARQESKSLTGVSILKDFFRSDIDPNTAMSQVTSYAMSDLYYLPPGTIPPMVMPFDPTASIPLALLTVDHPEMNETKLYDVAYFNLRNMLQGISGVIAPAVYGGNLRRILAYVDPYKMSKLNLSSMDVVRTLLESNVLIPTGNAKFGDQDVQIVTNALVEKVEEMNQFLIRAENGVPISIADVGHVEDSHQIQTNVVRINGKRGVYIPIYRQPGANTIQVIDGVHSQIKSLLERLPKGMSLKIIADQSKFVRQAIKSLGQEVVIGGILAALVVLLFLGNLRASLAVFLSIPLSILACFIGLYAKGEAINAMTLGGLALAVGRLIDDSVVVLENIIRYVDLGKSPKEAALLGTQEVAMPVLAATVTTVIVFLPVVFLTGIGKFLFTPLALSVTFSILASYVVAMTLTPLFCAQYLKPHQSANPTSHNKNQLFEQFAVKYEAKLSEWMKEKRKIILRVVLLFFVSLLFYPFIGKELFPRADVGHLTLYLRMPTGTRIEKTETRMGEVEKKLKELFGEKAIESLITNIGVLYDWPAAYTPNSGPGDAFIELELGAHRKYSVEKYAKKIRQMMKKEFPEVELAVNTGGMITAALNMGGVSPINIQVTGKDMAVSRGIAEQIVEKASKVKGAVDIRIQERLDYPQIEVVLNREKIAALRLTVDEVVKNMVTAFNSSISFKPAFWIDPKNGNHYFLGAQYPEKLIENLDTLKNLPLTGHGQLQVVRLKEIADFKETKAPSEIRHLNIQRLVNVFMNVSGRDVGSVAGEIARKIRKISVPEGYAIRQRGEIESMRESFSSLGGGLILAVVLVYLILAGQFRSFRDPLLILIAVPLGIIGVFLMLWITRTTLNIQSFIGIIFMVGISVSNGILLIEFANRLKGQGISTEEAAIQAARVRLRPILMTTIAALLGLLPMAIGIGHGAETNVPLGRAVVGGLLASTILTLMVLPLLYVSVEKWKFSSFWKLIPKLFNLILLLILLSRNAFANEIPEKAQEKFLSLDEVMTATLRQNPQVIFQKARALEAQADYTIARAALMPQVNLSGMDSFGLGGSSQAIGLSGVVNSPFRRHWAGGFDASWALFDFGHTGYKVKAAKKEAKAAWEEYEQHIAEIKLATFQTYAQNALHFKYVQFLKERIERLEKIGEEIDSYVQSGLKSSVELDLAQATLEEVKAKEAEDAGLLKKLIAQLKELMGEPDREDFYCQLPESNFSNPENLSVLIANALSKRPELQSAKRILEARHAEVKSARRAHAPKIVGASSVGALEDTNPHGADRWSASIGMKVPIFDGFKMRGGVKKAKEREIEANAELLFWENRIKQQAASAYAEWEGAENARKFLENRYQLAQSAYDLARKRYTEKMGTFIELQNAESSLAQAFEGKLKGEGNAFFAYHQLLIMSASEDFQISEPPKSESKLRQARGGIAEFIRNFFSWLAP